MMGAIGSIAACAFGVIWIIIAASMGAPGIFPLFGVVFVILGICNAIYNYKNATGKNRYSTFDITDGNEEPDPLEARFGGSGAQSGRDAAPGNGFCPYCGTPADAQYSFCRKCGRPLPRE